MYGSDPRRVVVVGPPGGVRFFWEGSKIFQGRSYENLNTSAEFSAQAQSIGTLYAQIGLRGGSVYMKKSQRHTRSGAGRGVSQANEKRFTPSRIVPA